MSIRSLFHKIFYIEETKETVKMREMLKDKHKKKHVVYVDDIALEKDNLFIVHGENARGEIAVAMEVDCYDSKGEKITTGKIKRIEIRKVKQFRSATYDNLEIQLEIPNNDDWEKIGFLATEG